MWAFHDRLLERFSWGTRVVPSNGVCDEPHGAFEGCQCLKRLELTNAFLQRVAGEGNDKGSFANDMAGHMPERLGTAALTRRLGSHLRIFSAVAERRWS
jgi:hypothetical protein